MKQVEGFLIIQILRLLCPYLKQMAARTENPTDDKVVDFVCRLVGADDTTAKE